MKSQYANVDELIKRMPAGYEQSCFDTKAIERKREIKSPVDLMRLCLLYLVGGYSLLEISVISKALDIAKINDSGFLERFAKCREWFSRIVQQVVPKALIDYPKSKLLEQYCIVAVDASDVKEKGRSGRIFKLHYVINLFNMCAAAFKITNQKVGETLLNFTLKDNWLVIADRAYGTLVSIEHCLNSHANFILRLKHGAFNLYNKDGSQLNLLEKLQFVTSDTAANFEVFVNLKNLGKTKLRVCAIKIPNEKFQKVERTFKHNDSKKQRKTSKEALDMAKYVVVITALPETFSADEIVSLYRLRWQIEIYFKRLKSIIDFGNVPLKREDSIMAWLNGKLLISFLIEQMVSEVSFSP